MVEVKTWDCCKVLSRKSKTDRGDKESDLEVGDLVIVARMVDIPVKKGDPYLKRSWANVLKFETDGSLIIPSKDNDKVSYVVDPRNLEQLTEEEDAALKRAITSIYES